jgi:lysophospholipase L1-like esterase
VSANTISRCVRLGLLVVLVVLVAALVGPAAAAPGGNGHGPGGNGGGGGGKGGGDQYVALGDSFSSGVGTGSYTLDAACKRSVYAYPYLLAQKRKHTTLTFVACSGATTADLLANQMQSVTSKTTIVTLTIGGNDIDFANLIYQCTVSDCTTALETTTASLKSGTLGSTLGSSLDTVYTTIKQQAAPNATIIVLGYPHEFSGATCAGAFGISAAEETDANALADALDNLIATHAQQDDVTYQSAIPAFSGHEVCTSSPWLNGLVLSNTDESYHPNKAGQSSGYLPLVRAIVG